MTIITSKMTDNIDLHIEVADAQQPGSRGVTSGSKVTSNVNNAWEEAKKTIVAMSEDLVGAVKSIDKKVTPDEFTLEFGLKFSADGNVFVASASAEASLQITMKYTHSKETA